MSNWSDRLLFWHMLSKQHDKDVELYNAIKAEPELAPRSKKLGVRSITFSLIFFAILAAAVGGIALIIEYLMPTNVFFGLILIILLAVVAFYTVVALYIRAFRLMILQLKLNKTAISWVAMVLSIIPTLIIIVLIIMYISIMVSGAK